MNRPDARNVITETTSVADIANLRFPFGTTKVRAKRSMAIAAGKEYRILGLGV
jgi:hypothetical protein